jgi:hypothetical protein
MNRVHSPAILLHAIVAVVLCGSYFAVGGSKVWRALTSEPATPFTPPTALHSSDAYLQEMTGMTNGSERLLDIFAKLPQSKPIYVFIPKGGGYYRFVPSIIAYLGWPRPVRILEVQGNDAERELRSINPSSTGALVFCGLKTAGWISGMQLGSNVFIVPLDLQSKSEQ